MRKFRKGDTAMYLSRRVVVTGIDAKKTAEIRLGNPKSGLYYFVRPPRGTRSIGSVRADHLTAL